MGWAEHADDGVVRRGATARLAFTNKADVAIEAHLTLIVRADGRVLEKPLGKQTVGPRSSTVVAADVAVAGLRASELAYSAQIMVVASMFVDGERLPGGVSTEPLYYHAEAESGALLVYGDRAYREQFGAGDFRQRRVRTAGEPEIDGIGVAHFATSEELVGDPADGPIGVPAEGKR